MSGGSMPLWQKKMSNVNKIKNQIKGWSGMFLGGLILAYVGAVYRLGGFGLGMIYALSLAIVTVPLLFTAALRRLGTVALWCGTAVSFCLLFYTGGDLATCILVWALTCAIPLSLSFVWPLCPRIKPLAMRALPAAGAIAMAGTLLYSRLHFGSWDFLKMIKQMVLRLEEMIRMAEQISQEIYVGEQLTQMQAMTQFLRGNSGVLVFTIIQLIVYALFGLFFLSVWRADRKAQRDGYGNMLGSWQGMIPSQWVARLYMFGYLVVLFLPNRIGQNMIAAFDLFGFLFVFAALYRLLQYLRKKGWPSWAKKGVIGGLFLLAYWSVGNALLSPYMILLYAGWWISAFPAFVTLQKK